MYELLRNSEDRFSRNEALMKDTRNPISYRALSNP